MKNTIIILLIASSLLLACSSQTKNNEKNANADDEMALTLSEAQFKNAQIQTTIVEEKNMATVLKLNGKVDVPPQNVISVSVPLGGYLRSTK